MKKTFTLNTKAQMPMIGLGTWNADPEKVGLAIHYALSEAGYRHIDCAAVYHNEKEVGEALAAVFNEEKIKREEVFITSKLWSTEHAKNAVEAACRQTLRDLQLDYLDLYLMHFGIAILPGDGDEPLDSDGYVLTEKISIQETWEAMENLVQSGLVKAIGVSNFTAPMLLDLLSYAKIKPAVNQIELHPYLQQSSLVGFCQKLGITVTAYSPLGSYGTSMGEGKAILIEDLVIKEIAKKYGKSPAQVLLRWGIQRNTIVIPKSVSPEHMKKNAEIFDFELSSEDMEEIKKLDRKLRFVNPEEWWKLPYFD